WRWSDRPGCTATGPIFGEADGRRNPPRAEAISLAASGTARLFSSALADRLSRRQASAMSGRGWGGNVGGGGGRRVEPHARGPPGVHPAADPDLRAARDADPVLDPRLALLHAQPRLHHGEAHRELE